MDFSTFTPALQALTRACRPIFTWSCLGCTVSATFFLFASKRIRIWILFSSYLQVYSNTIFSLHSRFKILQQIFASRFSHTGKYLLQNVHLKAYFCKTLSKFHIQANIRSQIFTSKQTFTCTYSHTSEYSLCIASNYSEKPFKSLGPQIIFGSF